MVEIVDPQGNPELDLSLLPIFQRYKQENESWIPDFNLWSYLNLRGDHDLAAAFSKLFWPDFTEVDGCVFLAQQYDSETFKGWKERLGGNKSAIEGMINHVHISDLFLNSPKEVKDSKGLDEYIAKILMVCWKHALQEQFPGKQFVFSLDGDYGYTDSISFYQAEHGE